MKNETTQTTETPMADDRVLTAGNFKPILFSTPMVQAILRGEKTQTRRIVNYPKKINEPKVGFSAVTEPGYFEVRGMHENGQYGISQFRMKYKVGDILWVRESFLVLEPEHCEGMKERFYFKASHNETNEEWLQECINDGYPYKWKPSLFMPRSACRIFLKVKKIRIERLNNISESDAIAEGIERWTEERMVSKPTHYKVYFQNCKPEDLCSYTSDPIDSYETLWQKINGEKSWGENPYVFVYEFERTDASFACS